VLGDASGVPTLLASGRPPASGVAASAHDIEAGAGSGSGAVAAEAASIGAERTAMQRAGDAFVGFLKGTDVFHALRQGDSAAFLAQIRRTELPTMLANVEQMRQTVRGLAEHEIAPGVRDSLTQSLDSVHASLSGLNDDNTIAHRALGAALTTTLGLAPLALAVPYKLNQLKYLALQIAFYAKTAAYTAGAMANPNTGARDWVNIGIERHVLTGVQAAIYAAPALLKNPKVQEMRDNIAFNLAASAVAIGTLTASYYADKFGSMFESAKQKLTGGETPTTMRELPDAARPAVTHMLGLAKTEETRLSEAERLFEGVVNDATSGKVSKAADKYRELVGKLEAIAGAGQDIAVPEARRANSDLVPKVGLAVMTAAATVTTTALIIPDWAGVVDFAADAAFVSALMVATSQNPKKNLQNALDDFKNFVGLSATALPVLAFDKGLNFINPHPPGTDTKNIELVTTLAAENIHKPGFWVATAVLTAANLTLSGHAGEVIAKAAGAIMNRAGQADAESAAGSDYRPDHHARPGEATPTVDRDRVRGGDDRSRSSLVSSASASQGVGAAAHDEPSIETLDLTQTPRPT
jgi:hypothetical protein